MISRRQLSQLLVGLPILGSLSARAQASAPKRLVLIRSAYGVKQANWNFTLGRPFDVNQARTLDPIFGPAATPIGTDGWQLPLSALTHTNRLIDETNLTTLKSELNVIRGLDVMAAHHFHNTFSVSTASLLDVSDANEYDRSAFTYSLDMVLERKAGFAPLRVVPLANIRAGADAGLFGFSMHPDVGVSMTGHESASHRRVPYQTKVHAVFQQLFANQTPGPTGITRRSAEAAKAQALKRVRAVRALSSLSALDKQRLEAFEQQLTQVRLEDPPARPTCSAPSSLDVTVDLGPEGNHDAMIDLVVAGLACGRTTLACVSIPGFDEVVPGAGAWHDITHGGAGNAFTYERFVANRVAHLVEGLRTATDVDGSRVLDNTLVVWVGELGDHNLHLCLDLPVMTFGGANLGLRRGFLLDYRKRNAANTSGEGPLHYLSYFAANTYHQERRAFGRPYNDLLVSIFRAMGVPPPTFHAENLESKFGSLGRFGNASTGFGTYDFPLDELKPGGRDAALFARVYRQQLPSDASLPGLFTT